MSRLVDNYNANECCKSLKEMPKIRQQKVDQDIVNLTCKNINEIVKDKNTSNDECRIFYEASYMIRTLWKRVEENEKLDEPLDLYE